MNVSAALSIKTGGVKGGASGKYIDTDKFQDSNLNFFIQVKVTNQEHMDADYTQFQHLDMIDPSRFTDIYGVRKLIRCCHKLILKDHRILSSRDGKKGESSMP